MILALSSCVKAFISCLAKERFWFGKGNSHTPISCHGEIPPVQSFRRRAAKKLHVRTLPGLNPESGDLCYLAYRVGLTHAELVKQILDAALKRYGMS